MTYTFGSLFAGIGGFDLGFERAGLKCAFQCEIENVCRKVLDRHFPSVQKYEDITRLTGKETGYYDVLTGGFPCQDVSIAGSRTGLTGERSGLFHEFARLIKEIRPQFAVIENVPGLISSWTPLDPPPPDGELCEREEEEGSDFETVLLELQKCGATDIAWRVLDSKHFGVAQRRRRVFVVADFRGERAAEVLFEREGVRGNPAEGRSQGEEVAGTLGARSCRSVGAQDAQCGHLISYTTTGPSKWREGVGTLRAEGGDNGGGSETLLAFGIDGGETGFSLRANPSHSGDKGDGGINTTLVAAPLTARSGKGAFTDPVNDNVFAVAPTLSTKNEVPSSSSQRWKWYEQSASVIGSVRRLTPTECERLQGFPDGWTAWDHEDKPISDTARYRMLGNAVTVNVAEWIGHRLRAILEGRQP